MVQRIEMGMVNCFLITGEKSSVLVDTGTKEMGQDIYEQVKDKNVACIVLTHGHHDHTGSAKFLSGKLGVPIAMHEDDYEIVKKPDSRTLQIAPRMKQFFEGLNERAKETTIEFFTPNYYFTQGDNLTQFGVQGEIVYLPGHTKGSIGILTKEGLIAGDTMVNMGQPSTAVLYEDENQMMGSYEEIKKLQPKLIFTAHGAPFTLEEIV